MTPITGAAYCADQVFENTQTLTDGTHISQPSRSIHVCRDSAGRTRQSRPYMVSPQSTGSPVIVEIMDPVAGYQYVLDTVNKVAHRMALQASSAASRANGAATTVPGAQPGGGTSSVAPATGVPPRPQMSSESLGTKDFDGVLAEGRRTTITFAAGSVGNDRPITSIAENWFSADLKVTVLSKNSDPRMGESIQKLTNISRAEPDPLLFAPPPDYSVVEETGRFTISMPRP